jgi:CHAT domain-containing protein
MTRFYANLLGRRDGLEGPLPKAEALREAKQWLRSLTVEQAETELRRLKLNPAAVARRGERKAAGSAASYRPYEHPYEWAGFVRISNPN